MSRWKRPPPPKVATVEEVYYFIDGPKAMRITDGPVAYVIKVEKMSGEPTNLQNTTDIVPSLRGPGSASPKVDNTKTGFYKVSFVPPSPGLYNLDIRIHGKRLFQEKCDVLPSFDAPEILECKILNLPKALKLGTGACKFQITIRHKGTDKPFVVKKSDLTGTVTGPEDRKLTIMGPAEGSDFRGEFRGFKPGEYMVRMFHEGHEVLRTPGVVQFTNKADVRSVVDCRTPAIKSGSKLSFLIRAKDAYDLPVASGGDPFEVEAAGPRGSLQGKQVSVLDNEDGTYSVGITLDKTGNYEFYCELGGTGIQGSPVKIRVE